MTRYLVVVPLVMIGLLLTPASAHADLTAFWGLAKADETRSTRGFAAGLSLIVFGFEFEYADTPEDVEGLSASLTTGMVNAVVQTPTSGVQFYVTAGGGFFRQRLEDLHETNFGTNLGGGVKIRIAGPLRLRLDYRVFGLRGEALTANPQRFYAGANLSF